jgi:hypothetical protein
MICFFYYFRQILAFKTPEECFLDELPTTKFEWGSINPQEFVAKLTKAKPTTASQTYHKNVNF